MSCHNIRDEVLDSMTFWEILGIFVALLTPVLAWITWFEKRRDRKLKITKEQKELEKQDLICDIKKSLCDEMRNCIQNELKLYMSNDVANMFNKQILNELVEIKKDVLDNNERLNEAMLERIQGEIIQFCEDLKNGSKKSSIAYEHIYESYRKYKSLGGNGFIDDMFNKYIRGEVND